MSEETIFVVDDDPRVLKATTRLLAAEGYAVRPYVCALNFLSEHDDAVPGCAILDLAMPQMNGLEVQHQLSRQGRPIIFLTGRGDIPSSVAAMKSGAIDFLVKPIDRQVLLDVVQRAMDIDRQRREAANALEVSRKLLDRLTDRERQVIRCVAEGLMNKQIAARLGIVEKTVKVHRARALGKLGIQSVAKLIAAFPELSAVP
jgi:RNA polymerase sigma factor (sigma-70 family)